MTKLVHRGAYLNNQLLKGALIRQGWLSNFAQNKQVFSTEAKIDDKDDDDQV